MAVKVYRYKSDTVYAGYVKHLMDKYLLTKKLFPVRFFYLPKIFIKRALKNFYIRFFHQRIPPGSLNDILVLFII